MALVQALAADVIGPLAALHALASGEEPRRAVERARVEVHPVPDPELRLPRLVLKPGLGVDVHHQARGAPRERRENERNEKDGERARMLPQEAAEALQGAEDRLGEAQEEFHPREVL
jgi:hypothetical protein